jgi:hypothetical protein
MKSKTISILILIIGFIIFIPLLSIWSLNVLFPVLAIPYTWKTWLAIILIQGLFKTPIDIK